MPIVTISVRKPKTVLFKTTVLNAIHTALVASGVNPHDVFHRVHELADEDFRYDPTFPDLQSPRTDDFVLVEILLGAGRSVKLKRQILKDMMQALGQHGLNPENVMVCFQDVPWENWSPAGGRMPHA